MSDGDAITDESVAPSILNHLFSHTLKLYKSNRSIPELTRDDIKYIKSNISKYLFSVYQRQSRDMIIRTYTSAREVYSDLKLSIRDEIEGQYRLKVLSLKSRNKILISTQSIVFISKTDNERDGDDDDEVAKKFNTLILARLSPLHQIIIKSLNNLTCDPPLIISNHELSNVSIYNFINHLFETGLMITDVQLTYTLPGSSVINDNLRNIVVNIPQSNISTFKIRQRQQEDQEEEMRSIMSIINEFLFDHSKLKFEQLSIHKFISNIINISIDGKIKIKPLQSSYPEYQSNDNNNSSQWLLIKNFYELLH
ncbi:hypothetical protein DFJ63DRAFT_333142 [Scheffersomyces coipomensis]|uniref:uncharacterized protein n=1 Tax=Scheffersomyces coipomensis TaxID=1788519 RepID=UPI00315DFB28